MISTSEIKISVVIAERYVELAVRALHDALSWIRNPANSGLLSSSENQCVGGKENGVNCSQQK